MDKILGTVATQGGDYIEGALSKAINRKELVGDIVKTWQQKASDRLTLVFAVDIAHSKSIIDDFVKAGVNAMHLDAYTPKEERRAIINQFRAGEIQILSSVNVLGTGFDAPEVTCGILARPTLSETVDMQQKGRLLRTAPGKTDALLLDHAGNTLKFGLPIHFEVPDLGSDDKPDTRAKRKQQKMVACANCGFALEPAQMTCPACGVDRVTRSSEIHYLDGELVCYASANDAGDPLSFSIEEKKSWYLSFLWYAGYKGNKPGWAYYAYREKFDNEKPPYRWKDLTPIRPDSEQSRWLKYYQIKSAKRWEKQQRAG